MTTDGGGWTLLRTQDDMYFPTGLVKTDNVFASNVNEDSPSVVTEYGRDWSNAPGGAGVEPKVGDEIVRETACHVALSQPEIISYQLTSQSKISSCRVCLLQMMSTIISGDDEKVKMVLDLWCGGASWSDGNGDGDCGGSGWNGNGAWGYGAGKLYDVVTGAEIVNGGKTFHFHTGHVASTICGVGFSTSGSFLDGPNHKAFGVTRQSSKDRFVWEGVQIGTSGFTYNYFYRESAA